MKTIVITDLDGCLLDSSSYSWEAHREALEDLRRRGIPVVFCTSKTRAETEVIRRETGNADPFIVENGGAVVMPSRTIALGLPYARILLGFDRLKSRVGARGFSDMTAEEIARESGLTLEQARLARQREWDEPFTCVGDPIAAAVELGLRCSRGGRFWHLHGDTDKGKAIRTLLRETGPARTVGIGDSMLDLHLLEACEVRAAVARPDGTWDEVLESNFRDLRRFRDWSSAVRELVPP